ncbi:polysaccharide pyruvyl transferase family protein [Bacteroides caecigallinarum]|nr:polysaccharide pyruvyl transferase family protein [Bacteroides caecigallinarum]
MRVCIITLPVQSNYGGILQTYAMQTILERMGHSVKVIGVNTIKKLPPIYIYLLRIWEKKVLHKPVYVFFERDYNRYIKRSNQLIKQFIEDKLNMRYINSFSDIEQSEFDCFIVGSDQVWRRPFFINDFNTEIENAFLRFASGWDVKRIAYAASFGVDFWEYLTTETSNCSELAKKFDAISVRELSGINLCNKYLGVKAIHVLDPTMLLETKDYIQLFKDKNAPQSKGELLTYILDETPAKKEYINRIVSESGFTPFSVISYDSVKPSIETWLRGFYDAKLIVTDSFHACVFSIIFNKPFSIIANPQRGVARIKSLLNHFGIDDKNNIIIDSSNSSIKIIQPPYIKWNELKIESLQFLKDNLNNI